MKKILLIVLAVLILGIFAPKLWIKDIFKQSVDWTVYKDSNPKITGSLRCVDTPKYYVILKDLADSIGSNILVKYKYINEKVLCQYEISPGDFEIKNQDAEYFDAVINNLLVLDSGTGPDLREIIIYDLDQRREVFSDVYSGSFEYGDKKIIYWADSKQAATSANCPDMIKNPSDYLYGARVETQIALDLTNLTKKETNELRCRMVQ